MRWLARRWLRGKVLELGQAKSLYYPEFATGPGFVLTADKYRAFEGYVALGLLAPVVLFAAPKRLSLHGLTSSSVRFLLSCTLLGGCGSSFWPRYFGSWCLAVDDLFWKAANGAILPIGMKIWKSWRPWTASA